MGRRLVARVSDHGTVARFVRAALSHRVETVALVEAPTEEGAHSLEIRLGNLPVVTLAAEPTGRGGPIGHPLLLSPLHPTQLPELRALVDGAPPSLNPLSRSASEIFKDTPPLPIPADRRRTDPNPDGYDPEVAFISPAPVIQEDKSLSISIEVTAPVDTLEEERSLSGSVVFDIEVLAREQRRTSSMAPGLDGLEEEDTMPLTIAADEAPFTVRRTFVEIKPGVVVDGKYEIVELLGSGSVGAVYRAVHNELARMVAIKVLHPYYRNDPHLANAFRTEARAASLLQHANTTIVHDFGTTPEGLVYIVMELVDGRSLQAVLDEERSLDIRRSLEIMLQVTSALAAAHDHGVVHRDVKPDNIILVPARDDEGNAIEIVKVCDFGIAAIDTSPPDELGYTAGTPAYMAPEQTRGMYDARTDIYACGAVLYEMLTGEPPFAGQTPSQTLRLVATEAPRPPSTRVPMPATLDAAILRALEKLPLKRHDSMRSLRSELKKILSSLP